MKFGDKDYEIGPIDAKQMVRLIKFTARVYEEVDEDQKEALLSQVDRANIFSLINILSEHHIYDLTAILLGATKKEVGENWNIVTFTELLAEISEHNDVQQIVKNVQRAAAAIKN